MYIESLELKNFRNYEELSIVLDPGTNILYGDNAQGKTNVLEAVYLCGTTKSHRGSKDKEMIRFEHPSKKRPFYAMDDPEDTRYTLSFDLLYHGLEITTGGQRIHDLSMLEEKIQEKGMTEEGLEQYLDAFRFGMPPHGGLCIGLERLTMQLLGEDNVREACLFPRDMSRLEP